MIDTSDFFIANTKKFISSGFGEEMMLMNLETGDYFGLNIVSADIWKHAETKKNIQQIIDHLLQNYNVDEDTCKTEVLNCVQLMVEKELLQKI